MSSSSDSNSFDTNGLEKIQYKSTTTATGDDDGFAETKMLTIFFKKELKDNVPTKKSMLDDSSWQLVVDNDDDEEKRDNDQNDGTDNDEEEKEQELPKPTKSIETKNDFNQKLYQAKLAFQSPIPTIAKLSVSSKHLISTLLVANRA